jgi:hypothetical protein
LALKALEPSANGIVRCLNCVALLEDAMSGIPTTVTRILHQITFQTNKKSKAGQQSPRDDAIMAAALAQQPV